MKKDNIPGLEGYYISRLGTLWSRYHKSGKLTHSEWHKVKPNHNQKGYLFVQKKGKCWYLHRLVALAWIPNPNNYPIVCHKDNNPRNNRVSNLYWGTQKMNIQQAVRENRFTQFAKRGKENPMYGKRGKLSPFYGIPRSSETKRLISIANKGRKVREDTKLKISNTLKSLKRGKTVFLRDDIIKLRYEDKLSQSAIAERLGLHQTAISKFLRNYESCKS
jgi:hypothetical protein